MLPYKSMVTNFEWNDAKNTTIRIFGAGFWKKERKIYEQAQK